MKRKDETETLNEAILLLETIRIHEGKELKEQFHHVFESIKPVNLIKNGLHDVVASPDVKNNIVGSALSVAIGALTKKILVGSSRNPIKKMFGSLLQFAVTNVVSKHSENIVAKGSEALRGYSSERKR